MGSKDGDVGSMVVSAGSTGSRVGGFVGSYDGVGCNGSNVVSTGFKLGELVGSKDGEVGSSVVSAGS